MNYLKISLLALIFVAFYCALLDLFFFGNVSFLDYILVCIRELTILSGGVFVGYLIGVRKCSQ